MPPKRKAAINHAVVRGRSKVVRGRSKVARRQAKVVRASGVVPGSAAPQANQLSKVARRQAKGVRASGVVPGSAAPQANQLTLPSDTTPHEVPPTTTINVTAPLEPSFITPIAPLFTNQDEEEGEERGARPMVRGPWLPVLDTDSFDLGYSIDFARDCGPVNPPGEDALLSNILISNWEEGMEVLICSTCWSGRQTGMQSSTCRAALYRCRAGLGLGDPLTGKIAGISWTIVGHGVVRKPTISSYWNEGDKNWLASTPSFRATMSRNFFQIIMRFLHCNDNSARGQPGHDPRHKIRSVLDLVNGSFANTQPMAQSVCVDERMVGFKGRHNDVQYMSNKKAHRLGVKLWILAEAGTGYTHQVRIYKGRNLRGPPPRTGLGYSVVMGLMEPHLDKGHHIICDNFFSSPSLCHDLFDRKMFCTGVVAVRPEEGMPSSFIRKRPPRGSSIVRRQGPLMADRRSFTILSTMGSPRY